MEKGFVHIYTGNGKGKTTAALGLTLRAVGAGKRVFFGQFTKGIKCSEHVALEQLGDGVTVRQYGDEHFVSGESSDVQKKLAHDGFIEVQKIMKSDLYDVVVLDEIIVAIGLSQLSEKEVLHAIGTRTESHEVVLTGRGASSALIAIADLVTEMIEHKHYYHKRIPARIGIEM